jgi:uncharacterized membrane protein (UPF0127 family)
MKRSNLYLFSNLFTALFIFFILVFFTLLIIDFKAKPLSRVSINNYVFVVDIAKTPNSWQQGLSNREKLAKNQAMLFIFPEYRQPNFWMKDMNFPIDIIWIKDKKIIDFDKNIPAPLKDSPVSDLETFYPESPVNIVLEVVAGTVDRLNIQKGDIINLNI